MQTWKLSIKPANEKGYNPFDFCRRKNLLGIGWSGAYIEKTATNLVDAKKLVIAEFKIWPYQIKYLIEDMNEGDHVWIHQDGQYYLCKAKKNIIFCKDIDKDFLKYDLGHARESFWVNIPEEFISGTVQRGVIAQRLIQRIWLTEEEVVYHENLFNKLSINPDWKPKIDNTALSKLIQNISLNALFSLMSPDDVEDLVAAFLQDNGWILIKSTCFRSKPTFEFLMVNKKSEIAYIQVKSGKNPDPLSPEVYRQYIKDYSHIFLFSTNNNPYPGIKPDRITTIQKDDIINWAIKNLWALSFSLKIRLWIFLNKNNG